MDVIEKGQYDFSVPVQYDGSGVFAALRPPNNLGCLRFPLKNRAAFQL